MNKLAFLEGYLNKVAVGGSAAADVGNSMVDVIKRTDFSKIPDIPGGNKVDDIFADSSKSLDDIGKYDDELFNQKRLDDELDEVIRVNEQAAAAQKAEDAADNSMLMWGGLGLGGLGLNSYLKKK